MNKNTILYLKMAALIIAAAALMLLIFWLPYLADYTADMYPEYAYLKYPVLIGLYITAVPFYYALYKALVILKYVGCENAFSKQSVESLKHIRICALAEIVIYAAMSIYLLSQNALHPGIAIIIGAIIFAAITISLFTGVLQQLLSTAIEIKSENDLTV
jgi:hypothetical protein